MLQWNLLASHKVELSHASLHHDRLEKKSLPLDSSMLGEAKSTMSEKFKATKAVFDSPESPPKDSPMVEKGRHNAFEEVHALYLQGDYEGAFESAKKHLADRALALPTRIQLSLIIAQCGSNRQDRYTHVSLAAACSHFAKMIRG
jgi:hypothetical protein